MLLRNYYVSWVVAAYFIGWLEFSHSKVPQEQVDALQQIVTKMGAMYWRFNADLCEVEHVGVSPTVLSGSEGYVECNCNYENNTVCHITKIVLKSHNLPGILPPELVKLPYLQDIDFAYNLLNGTIPRQWASMQLNSISVLVNCLSGEIPKELGNITSLTYLNLEANQFSGPIPSDIGKLINLKVLILSSNQLIGPLPTSFSKLTNLDDFRINDNNLSGKIPDFIQDWERLSKLRISDTKGPPQKFPVLRSITGIVTLVLRNCNIHGEIPAYIWRLRVLHMMDVSFNKLVGEIPNDIARNLKVMFLTSNMMSGNIPDTILKDDSNIDLSYNNFTWRGPDEPACQTNTNQNINLYKSSWTANTIQRLLPCTQDVVCPRYKCSLHVNCGGDDITIKESSRKVFFEGDTGAASDSARFLSYNYWGYTSSGEFMDGPSQQNSRSIKITSTENSSDLYSTARLSPLSLTYFHYCLENGSYNVSLHFSEILYTNDNTYNSLGRRMFDIYIQGKGVQKNFNIEDEAHGARRPVIKSFNVTVADSTLEIQLYWASKGTTRIPARGDYGSLISAISVSPYFKVCSEGEKKNVTVYIVASVAVLVIFLLLGILWWRGCLKGRKQAGKDFGGLELQIASFSLKQIRVATNNFDAKNKIGEGGFGPVYKGLLLNGTAIAVKQLSSRSRQGNREFLNEIGMISCLQHPNLVKLYGCCIEGDQLLVIYEYMENNSLAQALFDSNESHLILDWPTRFEICKGIAKGLAFLHEESSLKIVHRDIKATNVLLDTDLTPKISDFGLARLKEDEKTHISTKIAGTIGYMAPEYALWGYLTDKVDVYSFGVLILEIVSGKSNNNYMPSGDFVCLLDWASHLQENKNVKDIVDKRLDSRVNKEEIERAVKIGLLCTNATPSVRPTMSKVVQMLEGKMDIPDGIPDGSTYTNDVRFKAIKDFHEERRARNQSSSGSHTQNSRTEQLDTGSSS